MYTYRNTNLANSMPHAQARAFWKTPKEKPGNNENTIGSESRKNKVWKWEVLGKCKEPTSEQMWKSRVVYTRGAD
jgi:hypothetical protein